MTSHRRIAALAGALAVVLAACGGGEPGAGTEDPAPANEATTASPAPTGETSTGGGATAGTAAATTSPADPDAPVAPDFTLELGTGGEFALSEEAKPVYMVFWAEW